MAGAKYQAVRRDVENILNTGLGPLLTNITDGSGSHTTAAILGRQLTKYFDAYYKLRGKFENEVLDCAILALTKSGKSTLLNAFIGASILPTNNVPETARIVSIQHTALAEGQQPSLQYLDGTTPVEAIGEDKIRAQLSYLNRDIRGRSYRKEDENILTLKMRVAGLDQEVAQSSVSLRLLDTPGPNEAGVESLRHQVERLLDNVDAVVYILDYTKLKTTEEAALLAKLKDANPQLVQRLAQRLFFVVNKVDQMHEGEGLQEAETKEYVAGLITSTINAEGFELKPEQVLLVSAQEALLSRLVLLGKATEGERQKFRRKVFGRAQAGLARTEAENRAAAAEMLEDSHLVELEQSVLGYLYNHAGGLKLVSLLDDIISLLHEVENVAVTGQAALRQSASELLGETEQLKRTVADTLKNFHSVQQDADAVEAEVVDNVRARMQTLKEKLFAHVEEVLDTAKEPSLPAVKAGGWLRAWHAVKRLLPSGGAKDASDGHLREVLQELHKEINDQIEAEVQAFWHDLEVSVNEKQGQMIATINGHLTRLARDIEGVVGSVLDLALQPVRIQMEPPSAQQFHESLQDLFHKGIGQRRHVEERACEEQYTVWEKKYRGLCNSCEYYEGRPATRTVQKQVETTVYELQPEVIKEHFATLVSATIDTSIRYVKDYVHVYLSDYIQAARQRIFGYAARYTETMTAALQAKSQSREEQEAGAAALQQHVESVGKLLEDSFDVLEKAATLFPAAREAAFCWVSNTPASDKEHPAAGAAVPLSLDSPQGLNADVKGVSADAPRGPPVQAEASDRQAEVAIQTEGPAAQDADSLFGSLDAQLQEAARAECLARKPLSGRLSQTSRGTAASEEVLDRETPPNEKAVQANFCSDAEGDSAAAWEASPEGRLTSTPAKSAGSPREGLSQEAPGLNLAHLLLRKLDSGELPVSQAGLDGTQPSGSTSSSKQLPGGPAQAAVLPAAHQVDSDENDPDGPRDLRESAIMRAASDESEWEHLEKEDEN